MPTSGYNSSSPRLQYMTACIELAYRPTFDQSPRFTYSALIDIVLSETMKSEERQRPDMHQHGAFRHR